MIVLDTHVLVWIAEGDRKLGPAARTLIETEAEAGQLLIPAICIWEIGMLVSKGRLALAREVGDWIDHVIALKGMALAPLLPAIALDSTRLPDAFHGDPADRLIVATARHHQVTLLTGDGQILSYAAKGHLIARDAQE